jgi:integrase
MDQQYRSTIDLGAGCGMRQSEIFAVEQDAVDFLGREVHVRLQVRIIDGQLVFSLPKGGKTRSVPLDEQTGLALAAHIAAYPPVEVTLPWSGPGKAKTRTALLLFTRPGERALHQGLFNDQQWRPARKAAGVAATRQNGMHVLRHTAASAWLAGGVDINTVAEWLGHADPGFTLRTYTHLMPDASDRGRRAMDAFWRGASALDVPARKAE